MTHVHYREHRDRVFRSLLSWGSKIGTGDWGDYWVQDGKVWLIDSSTATLLGDYFIFLHNVASGIRQGVNLFETPIKESIP